MPNQKQVDAVEHLLIALLKRSKVTLATDQVFSDAHASLMGSDGPGGPNEKSEAADYLMHLKGMLS